MKPEINNSVEVHPQLSHKGHPVDGVLVGAGSVYPNGMDHSTPEKDEPGRVSYYSVRFYQILSRPGP